MPTTNEIQDSMLEDNLPVKKKASLLASVFSVIISNFGYQLVNKFYNLCLSFNSLLFYFMPDALETLLGRVCLC